MELTTDRTVQKKRLGNLKVYQLTLSVMRYRSNRECKKQNEIEY